jgi:hypothetical protein
MHIAKECRILGKMHDSSTKSSARISLHPCLTSCSSISDIQGSCTIPSLKNSDILKTKYISWNGMNKTGY